MNERIGFGRRLVAGLIDWITIIAVSALVSGVFGYTMRAYNYLGGGIYSMAAIGAPRGFALVGLVWIVWEGTTGQALGKKLMKIRIKAADGSEAGVRMLLLRAAVKYGSCPFRLIAAMTGIDERLGALEQFAVLIGFLFVLGRNRQALYDLLLKAAVWSAAGQATAAAE